MTKISCPECGHQLNEGMGTDEQGQAFVEFYCMNEQCAKRYITFGKLALVPEAAKR